MEKTGELSSNSIEAQRNELFHMILFAMPWVMIGEYAWDFRDFAVAAVIVLAMVVWLGLYSIKLYDLEDQLPNDDRTETTMNSAKETKRQWLFALIFIFEGIAILITWMILLKWQREHWLIPCFAFIAGLHFIPLANTIKHKSYYVLGIWVCIVAGGGFTLLYKEIISIQLTNTIIAYGCAAGAIVDGLAVVARTDKMRRDSTYRSIT